MGGNLYLGFQRATENFNIDREQGSALGPVNARWIAGRNPDVSQDCQALSRGLPKASIPSTMDPAAQKQATGAVKCDIVEINGFESHT